MSIIRHDFISTIIAKQFAFELIEKGIQFNFSPEPLSISYPEARPEPMVEQPTPG